MFSVASALFYSLFNKMTGLNPNKEFRPVLYVIMKFAGYFQMNYFLQRMDY